MTTYHCVCSNLLLFLPPPLTLSSLARRKPPVLDRACIITLPDHLEPSKTDPRVLNSTLDAKPIIVRREDGFEKRRLRRCDRCGCAWAYELSGAAQTEDAKDGGGKGAGKRVLYVLADGLITTEEIQKSLFAEQDNRD